jgi:hypothetical protein
MDPNRALSCFLCYWKHSMHLAILIVKLYLILLLLISMQQRSPLCQQLEGNQHLPNPTHSACGAKMMGSSGWYVKENHFLFISSDLRHKAYCTEHKKLLLLFTIATILKIFIVLP